MTAPRQTFAEIRTGGIPHGGRLVEQEDHAATAQTPFRRAGGGRHGVGYSDA
jgi:hypothetical protein